MMHHKEISCRTLALLRRWPTLLVLTILSLTRGTSKTHLPVSLISRNIPLTLRWREKQLCLNVDVILVPILYKSSWGENRGNNVDLVLCVLLGHQNSKIANSMKLVNFALFSSQYHVFELKNIRGNLIAPNSNRWSLSNKIAMSQEDNRKIISLFGQEKSIFLHPWMLKDLM